VSSLPPIEGTLVAKPFGNTIHGGLRGSQEPPNSGTLRGSHEPHNSGTLRGSTALHGTLTGDSNDSPESSAIAEIGGLISSLGSLSAQAQGLPLSAPSLPGLPQTQRYQPQTTDYAQLGDDSN